MVVLCIFLVIACFYDYGSYRIPNVLLLVMIPMGVIHRMVTEGIGGILSFLIAFSIMLAVLYPFFKIGGIGAGDVKLLSICGGYFSGNQVFLFLFFSLLVAAIFSIIKLLNEGSAKERFGYLGEYLYQVARTGNWYLYVEDFKEMHSGTLCFSGPVLISVLMHMGGVY
ncbi:MAG: prepilin peptidase [Lachnospiraceae bacterium]|nr:prepilin peptidase [Lachnospiraceae bacterium]